MPERRKKSKIFLIVCAGLCALGLVSGFLGYLLGGMQPFTVGSDGIRLYREGDQEQVERVSETWTSFENIEVTVRALDIELREGDRYSVEGANPHSMGGLKATLSGTTLQVKTGSGRDYWFGMNFGSDNRRVVITYPVDTSFSAIRLESGAGNIHVRRLSSQQLQIESGAGDVRLQDLTVNRLSGKSGLGNYRADRVTAEDTAIHTGNGDIRMTLFAGKGTSFSSGNGNIALEGTLHGKSEIRTHMGDVQLRLSQPEETLDYEIETNLGDLILSGRGEDENRIRHRVPSAADILHVKTNMGNVRMNFRQ